MMLVLASLTGWYRIGLMSEVPYISAIEAKGWCLYDAGTTELQTESWEEREAKRRPVEAVEEGGMYLFVPQPAEGQSLRDAYAVTKGLGPCLRIPDIESPDYKMLMLKFSPRLAVFTRFALHNAEVGLFTPPSAQLPESDMVVLRAEVAQEVFERDFDVISPEEFRRELDYAAAEWRV